MAVAGSLAEYLARGDISGLLEASTKVLQGPRDDIPQHREALSALGQLRGTRQAYYPLLQALGDPELCQDALLALAQLQDSRALFPVLNFFFSTDDLTIQERVFQYIHATHDPRAIDFLESSIGKSSYLASMAATALPPCTKNVDFSYQFCGSEERLAEALGVEGQIIVTNENLDRYRSVLEQEASGATPKPQTYVIPKSSKIMLIGGAIHEHVDVAQGETVLAAGEVQFERNGEGWLVRYINNRSNGYFPGGNSFYWVRRFFDGNSNVHCDPEGFSEVFPRDGFVDPEFLALFPYAEKK